MRAWAWIFLGLVVFGTYQHWQEPALHHAPGILVKTEPRQQVLSSPVPFEQNGYRITPLARFTLDARVILAKSYRFDRGAGLSPIDLVLGWGAMSDQSVLEQIRFRQDNRFYFWHVDQFPIPRRDIETHSANRHMIAPDAGIHRKLTTLVPGQIVRMAGYLVGAEAADGWRWQSSLTRSDTGDGACELVWVESLELL